ncbi:hypothetical protein P3T73_13895 [Kiritimatiellota bacterium B12222]|nr:hypothetical protein P3T73_13895 [Kiritimatiellota bacterium B12222]
MNYICCVLCFLLMQVAVAAEVQVWKSTNGHEFEGEFLELGPQGVSLLGGDGKTVTVPMAALDAASQAQAEQAYQEALKYQPVFTHKNRHLRFSLYANASCLVVDYFVPGNPESPFSYTLDLNAAEVESPKKRTTLKVTGLAGELEVKRSEVVMNLLMDNGAVISLAVDVNNRADLQLSHTVSSVPEGRAPVYANVSLNIDPLITYDKKKMIYVGEKVTPETVYADMLSIFDGYEIKYESFYGNESVRMPYGEGLTKGFLALSCEVILPGKPTLSIDAPEDRQNGLIQLDFYGGKLLPQGYRLQMRRSQQDQNHAGPFSIRLK